MKKWLIKTFCPSAETLAGYAADGIQKSVNGSEADVKTMIARYGSYAATVTEVGNRLARMAQDGTIDEMEKSELVKLLSPAFDKALDYAFTW